MTLVCLETGAFYLSDRLVRARALRCRGLMYDKAALLFCLKILATVFPTTALIACGFEHSVATMYLLPIGVMFAAGISAPLSVTDAVSNLALVTFGNVLGGTVLVDLVYWSVY